MALPQIIQTEAYAGMSASQRALIQSLRPYANKEGWCAPAHQTMGDASGCTRRTIINQIKTAIARGYIIAKEARPGHPCRYRLAARFMWCNDLPTKPARPPRPQGCEKFSHEEKSRREEESPPGAPHLAALDEGKPTDDQSGLDEEVGPGRGDGAIAARSDLSGPGGSSRRTAYNQPRQPRAPRKLRQRWRRRNAARAFLDAAAEIEARMARAAGRMPPVALAPEPEIITPAEWQRRQQRRSQAPRHPFLEAAERIEREQRGEAPIPDPQPWTLIERSLA